MWEEEGATTGINILETNFDFASISATHRNSLARAGVDENYFEIQNPSIIPSCLFFSPPEFHLELVITELSLPPKRLQFSVL